MTLLDYHKLALSSICKSVKINTLRYFQGDKNNINVQIKVNDDSKPCGQIYLTDQIQEVFEDILGRENVEVSEV